MKNGTRVRIVDGGCFHGYIGTVAKVKSHTIGVCIDNIAPSSRSKDGLYYYSPCVLVVISIDATGIQGFTHSSIKIKNVIFNDPATIVFWEDGTKIVVKCSENDIFDSEKGLAMACAKKLFGNQGNYYNNFTKWLPKEKRMDVAEGMSIRQSDIFNNLLRRYF